MDADDDEFDNLTKALALALMSAIEARKRQPPAKEIKITCTGEFLSQPLRSRAFYDAEALADPERHEERMALMAVRWIGERLYPLGKMPLMHRALEGAMAHQKRGSLMAVIADHRWDGVGRTADKPGWCC